MKEHELFDDREFKEAFKLYEKASSKDHVEIVNSFATEACFLYPREQDAMKLSALTPFNPERKRGTNYKTRLFYALAAKRGHRRGGGIKAEATKRYKRRRKSKGYLKVMMLMAARDLGANVTTKLPSSGSAAGRTHATPAALFRTYADIATGFTDQAAVDRIAPAFASALIKGARKKREFAEKRLARTADKYSAR